MVKTSYDQTNINTLVDEEEKIAKKYQTKYITNLSSNISQVMESEEKAQKLLPKAISEYGGYDQVKQDTAKYYQYSQFKRLYFNCNQDATKYNNQTGRIISMEFTCTNKLG